MAEQSATRTVISVRDPVEHARRRKPWHRAFSVAALKGYDEILGKRVQQFVTVLEQQTQPFNLAELISHFTCASPLLYLFVPDLDETGLTS